MKPQRSGSILLVLCLQTLGSILLFEILNTWIPLFLYHYTYPNEFTNIVQANNLVHASFITLTLNLPMFCVMFQSRFVSVRPRVSVYYFFRRCLITTALGSIVVLMMLILLDINRSFSEPLIVLYIVAIGWVLVVGYSIIYLRLYLIGYGELRNIIVFRFLQLYLTLFVLWLGIGFFLKIPLTWFLAAYVIQMLVAYLLVRWEFRDEFSLFDRELRVSEPIVHFTPEENRFLLYLILFYLLSCQAFILGIPGILLRHLVSSELSTAYILLWKLVPFIGHNTVFILSVSVFVYLTKILETQIRLADQRARWSFVLRSALLGCLVLILGVQLFEPWILLAGALFFRTVVPLTLGSIILVIGLLLPAIFYWVASDFLKILVLLEEQISIRSMLWYTIGTLIVRTGVLAGYLGISYLCVFELCRSLGGSFSSLDLLLLLAAGTSVMFLFDLIVLIWFVSGVLGDRIFGEGEPIVYRLLGIVTTGVGILGIILPVGLHLVTGGWSIVRTGAFAGFFVLQLFVVCWTIKVMCDKILSLVERQQIWTELRLIFDTPGSFLYQLLIDRTHVGSQTQIDRQSDTEASHPRP